MDIRGDAVRAPLTSRSLISEALAHPIAGPKMSATLATLSEEFAGSDAVTVPDGADMTTMLLSVSLGTFAMIMAGSGSRTVTPAMIDDLIKAANSSDPTEGDVFDEH